MNRLFEFIRRLLSGYSLGQRVVIIVVFIGILSAIIVLILWANRPEYEVLFSDLDPASASKIVEELRSMKVKYRLEDNGKTIYAPREEIPELRLKFFNEGLVGGPVLGYEIFDNAKVGMTTFMQQLNMRRALEGELAKTINNFPEVKNSRVHLVLPEERLFEERRRGSASVVLYLRPGKYLDKNQIKGIAALVANAVEGIEPADVVVVDADGNILSDGQDGESSLGLASTQWDLRHKVEAKLEKKVTDIVERIAGYQNAVVEVSVDLNFEQIERTMEMYDPDNVAVISEESYIESSASSDTSLKVSERHEKENVISNYELNKTIERFISNTGNINRLSVAVLVNERYRIVSNSEGKEEKEYIPWSTSELGQIESLVKSAIGYNEERNDVVEVRSIRFDKSVTEQDKEYFAEAEQKAMLADIIDKVFIILGVLVAFFIIRILMKNIKSALKVIPTIPSQTPHRLDGKLKVGIPEAEEEEIPEDAYIKKLSPEARAKLRAKDKMTKEVIAYAREHPEDTAKLIRSWFVNIDEE